MMKCLENTPCYIGAHVAFVVDPTFDVQNIDDSDSLMIDFILSREPYTPVQLPYYVTQLVSLVDRL